MRRVPPEADLDHFARVSDRLSHVGSSSTRLAVAAFLAIIDYCNTDRDDNSLWRMEGQARSMPLVTRPQAPLDVPSGIWGFERLCLVLVESWRDWSSASSHVCVSFPRTEEWPIFPLPYEPTLNWILYGLFALEFALLVGGLLFGKLNEDQTCRLPRPLRLLLKGVILLAAFVGWQGGSRGTPVEWYASLMFLGMAADFVGDLIMARYVAVPNRLIFGMMAFGLGHVFYIAAFIHLIRTAPSIGLWTSAVALLASVSFSLWAWYTQVRNPHESRAINVGSLLYGLLFGVTSALAITLALYDAQYIGLAIGALLFMISDLILGNWVIRGHTWKSVNDVIWVTYASGQLLIAYSMAAALNVSGG